MSNGSQLLGAGWDHQGWQSPWVERWMYVAGSPEHQSWLRMRVVSGHSGRAGAFEVGLYWMVAVGWQDQYASVCPLVSPFPQAHEATYSPP